LPALGQLRVADGEVGYHSRYNLYRQLAVRPTATCGVASAAAIGMLRCPACRHGCIGATASAG
jgi:hypothetical protein